ncbi:MAG: DNA repair protein RecN [Candidatus Izimaplasma sp.]|nr:DNA repair protein RecN [Candidatus Izimaplasma bacterium]
MLTYLSVKNFAIIENIDLNFKPGMTALTGETGAGKSLLIDAIGLLLGDRAASDVVRTNESKAIVKGIFTFKNDTIANILKELDIDYDDNEIKIRRQITKSNNNTIKVNNQTITLRDLRLITENLADIHTQHDTTRLINPETYIDLIDGFNQEKTDVLMAEYISLHTTYKKAYTALKNMTKKNETLEEKLDLLKFQIKELDALNLRNGEEEELKEAVNAIKNYDRLYNTLNQAYQLLEETNAIDRIYDAGKELENIATINETYQSIHDRFKSNYYELEDVYDTLESEINQLDFDPDELDDMQSRLSELDKVKRKYRKSIPELINYLDEIKHDVAQLDNFDYIVAQKKDALKEAYNQLLKKGNELTKLRTKTSLFIEKELLNILDDLELPKTRFKIIFKQRQPDGFEDTNYFFETGVDDVDFLISTNIGEPLMSLSKTASGGEMSRIMLGFKNLLASSLGLSLMIFDEIDSGVSGYVANQVAKKMKEIATETQVICITHIPQVAATSHHHIHISKHVVAGRTKAALTYLNGEKRTNEIAGMISGETLSNAAKVSAKELLDQ